MYYDLARELNFGLRLFIEIIPTPDKHLVSVSGHVSVIVKLGVVDAGDLDDLIFRTFQLLELLKYHIKSIVE